MDQSTVEVCNGLDDDCDGITDDDALVTGSPSEKCQAKGVCATHADKSRLVCVDGKETCDYSDVPGYSGKQEAVCGGEDDDCDGTADEDFWIMDPSAGKVYVGGACGVGKCAQGEVECASGGKFATCSTLVLSSPEVCNQVDDDCDGAVDNGLPKAFAPGAVQVSAGEPVPRAAAALVYHEPTQSLYIYGGAGRVGADTHVTLGLSDFWRFSIQTHSFHRLAGGAPGPRSGATLISDPAGSRLILVGGLPAGSDEGALWAYRLDDGQWVEVPAQVSQSGSMGVALDPVSWSLIIVKTDATGPRGLIVSLDSLDVEPMDLDLPYRRDAATAFDHATGTLFISGGYDELGLPTSDLFAVEPNGDVSTVLAEGDLPPRARHAITVMGDGSLLLVGGVQTGGVVSSDVFRVFPETGQVDQVGAASPPGLQMPSLESSGQVAWLYSGMDEDGHGFRPVMRYDADAVQWTSELLQVAPSGRQSGTMSVIEGDRTAYMFGGFTQDIASSHSIVDIWSMSLVNGTYKKLPMEGELPVLIRGAAAVDEAARAVYLYGGYTGPPDEGGELTSRFLRFDPDEPLITNLSAPGDPGPRSGHSLIWTGSQGKLLLYGGADDTGILGDVWSWSEGVGWAELAAIPHPRQGHAAFWDHQTQRMLAVGGDQVGKDQVGTLAAFDPVYHTWSELAQHPLLASTHGAAFFDRQSRTIMFLPGDGGTAALVMTLDEMGDVAVDEVALSPAPPARGALFFYDPFGRRAFLQGGAIPEMGTVSETWEIPQFCP